MTNVAVQAFKYGDRLHYEWNTLLLEKTGDYIAVLGEYGRKLHHHTKRQVFTVNEWTIELFPTALWFTVSADVVDGKIHQYYCNVCEPAKVTDNTVSFVDLDLDLVCRNGEWRVVDEDEFEINAAKLAYPPELVRRARQELAGLQDRVGNKRFPFDGTLERYVSRIPKR